MFDVQQKQKISQQQQLSAQQYQSLDLLALPAFDLQKRIDEVMNSNPLLEYETYPGTALSSSLIEPSFDDRVPAADDDGEAYYSSDDSWHDDLPIPGMQESMSAEQQSRREYFMSSLYEHESVHDKLLRELGALKLDEHERELAEAIIVAIDDRGFLGTNTADIAQSENCELYEVDEMLERLQKIFPPGVGARDLAECLRLQLRAQGEKDHRLYELVENIEDFGRNRIEYLARKMNVPVAAIIELGERIRTLNPYPLRDLVEEEVSVVNPEVSIVQENGSYVLKYHDEILPKIKISEHYEKMLADPSLPRDAGDFLRNKLHDAVEFKNSLERREHTIVRIARFIMENQTDFLDNGVERLRPMTMSQAAEALGNDEATVSRGCRGKYISTPQGVYEFKYFFTGGYCNADGEEFSSRAVQEKIREYIEDEDPHKPLSDEKISKKLHEDGFDVARRTVAKYREMMHILPSSMRRKF